MLETLERNLTGCAVTSIHAFYHRALRRAPRAAWPAMMHGMGYNFEFYDALFALALANVQLSMVEGDYTPRQAAMQAALLPFCSEYGVELGRDLQRTHRSLYAAFYETATGLPMPERYPTGGDNPWLDVSRRWAERMRSRMATPGTAIDRARYSLGYFWAIERLSIDELETMRLAWNGLGVNAAYLDAHCAVEGDHDAYATRALLAFACADEPIVREAVAAHEADLAGYYEELALLV
jgi:hypothetical protein